MKGGSGLFARGSPAAGFQSLASERSRDVKAWEPAVADESHAGKQVNRNAV
ncbi:Elongation factor Ts, partial [Clarias magur]